VTIARDLHSYLADSEAGLPRRIPVGRLSEEIARRHQDDGGVTINPRFGNLTGQSLFAVSLYPDRSVIQAGRSLEPAHVAAFIRQHADLLRDPRNCIGTWYDELGDVTYLDITAVLSDRLEALRLAVRFNQVGMYDLGSAVEISTGGTGAEPEDAPADAERLPPMPRRQRKQEDV
jgi:hypothetical protein